MSNTKIDNLRLNQIIEQDYKKQSLSVHSQDIDSFEKELTQNKENNDQLLQTSQEKSSLYSLTSFFTNTIQNKDTTKVLENNDVEIQEKLLNQILISQPNAKEQEIRLQLKQDILANTEIRLIKNNYGNLTIQISTSNQNSFQTLIANQFRLKRKIKSNRKYKYFCQHIP